MLDWPRLWIDSLRLNLQKTRHRRRVRAGLASAARPAPCQSRSDTGRARDTRCEACQRLDRSRRYALVCPDLIALDGEARCARDSADVRPYWGRAAALFFLPPLALYLALGLGAWTLLRRGGLDTLSPAAVLVPTRWPEIAEHRRARFQTIAVQALAHRDPATANLALFSAAQTGRGTLASNLALARLASLGGYHSLADQLHADLLTSHPDRARELAVAWHDDLLLSDRPAQLARLALEQTALPYAPREFWLHAYLESIRHPGVAADLLASSPAPEFPHPGLRHAALARAAQDRGDRLAVADELIALSGALPGQAARRFLVFSWLQAGDPARAREAALSTAHPAPPGEVVVLSHALFRAADNRAAAREALRSLFSRSELAPLVLAALIRDPDADLLREFAAALPPAERGEPRRLLGLWLAARRAGAPELARAFAAELEKAGSALPPELQTADTAPAPREKLLLAAAVLPVDREVLYALREAP